MQLPTANTTLLTIFSKEKQDVNKLKCSYFNKDPLLRIKPARMERVWEKPPIYLFREFASKKEIEDLKAISRPQVRRAIITQLYKYILNVFKINLE